MRCFLYIHANMGFFLFSIPSAVYTSAEVCVNKWWRSSVFRLLGDDTKCINIQSLHKYIKTEPLRMLYLVRSSNLEENMRFLICYSCCAECQTDTTTHVSITATSKALHKQLNKQCEIQDYLQFEQKKVNKGRCSSLFIHNSFALSPFVGVGGGFICTWLCVLQHVRRIYSEFLIYNSQLFSIFAAE